MQKNRIIKPKIRWKAKKSPDVWQGQYQALAVQQVETLKEVILKASYVEALAEIYYKTLTVLGHEPDVVPVKELEGWRYPGSLSL